MKVLQVNGYESPGRRFHGLAITPLLKTHGIESRHLVWLKDSNNPEVLTFDNNWARKYNNFINDIERRLSIQSILYPQSFQIKKMPAFKEADVLHLHIIHSGYFSLRALPKLTRSKPTVWTLHDPWALTGHCIHPFDCERWQIGCGSCPNLNSDFPLLRDNTRFLFNHKQKIYKKSNFDIIVASKWMHNMVEKSPLFQDVDVHHVPFGLDLNFFSPQAAPNARQKLGISDNALVICFRAVDNAFKGFNYILEALEKIKTKQNICLLTFNDPGLLAHLAEKFQIIDLGWVNDETLVRDAMVAADIFLMPSVVESFGMMAVEALACQKPIIVFDGTALPGVTFAPDVGISVPSRDSNALYQALQRLIDNPREREERGIKGRKIAELHYGDEAQASRLADIYRKVASK